MTKLRTRRSTRSMAYRESGIALITVLLLMILMTVLGLTMVVSVNSDMMINGYNGSARAAFYGADSGINIARQYLSNQLQLQVNTTACLGWGPNADPGCVAEPLSEATAPVTALNNLKAAYASFTAVNAGNAAQSWPSSFEIQDSATCTTSFTNAAGSPHITQATINGKLLNSEYQYTFNYVLCSTGKGPSLQRLAVKEVGTLALDVIANDTHSQSFSGYGQFVDQQGICPGAYLTPGTYTGPSFTNGAWTLGSTGPYIFTDPLQQHNAKIGYYDTHNNCNQTTSSTMPGVNVTLQAGLLLNAPSLPLPQSSYNQEWAVLDGQGLNTSDPTSQMSAYLKNVSGSAYSGGTGVYLPWYTDSNGVTQYGGVNGVGGGIYVEGNASILLTPGNDTTPAHNPTQIFTITQGSTTTTITINPSAGTTTFHSGSTTKTLTGIPQNPANSIANASQTMLYVHGTISALTGPGEGQAAIQNNAMITVAGSSDINITGDLIYATPPVTKDTGDTLLVTKNTPSSYQTLGVFTAAGSITLSSPYADKNLETDGSLAAVGVIAPGHCTTSNCGFKVSGHINTWNNVGGQIQTNQFSCDLTTANTYFDQRFKQWKDIGFAPPWFPSTDPNGLFTAHPPKPNPTQRRSSWAWIQ